MKIAPGTLSPGVGLAFLFAGPTFLLTLGLAHYYLSLPRPVEIPLHLIGTAFLYMFPASVAGAIIAAPALLVGVLLMRWLGQHLDFARTRPAWHAAGATIGRAISLIFGVDDPHFVFALIATSTICAALCRFWVRWIDEADLPSPWTRSF